MDTTTALRKEALAETYSDSERLVHSTCYKFQKKYGGNYEDLFCYAQEIFIAAYDRFDEDAGACFITWCYKLIWYKLLDRTRNDKRRNSICPRVHNGILLRIAAKEYEVFNVADYADENNLSEDAKTMILLTTKNPIPESKGKGKKAIKQLLQSKGWNNERIKSVFKEMTEVLND
jgi:DNA-directed RNA polymerase specialized sigma24 family protein